MQLENLDKLANQIYQEGIEKANQEKDSILSEAHNQAKKIIEDAEAEAKDIVHNAEKESKIIRSRVNNEVSVKAKQIISDLKREIESGLLAKSLEKEVIKAFDDRTFIKDLILMSTQYCCESDQTEIIISKDLNDKMDDFLNNKLKDQLPGFKIKVNDSIESGFIIENKKEGYFISFKDKDFNEFLKPYFSERIQNLLFKSS